MFTKRHKRQREAGNDHETDDEVQQDRKKIRSLPFRTSSVPRQNAPFPFSPEQGPASSFVHQTLTPTELLEDDLDDDLDLLHDNLPSLAHSSSSSSSSSASSIKVSVGDDDDMDITDSQPRPMFASPLPWQRSRANDMLSPPQLPHLLSPTFVNSRRIDTPIYGHFNTADFNLQTGPEAPPSANNTTTLTPVIREEEEEGEPAWWRRRRIPSTPKDADEAMTPVAPGHRMTDGLGMNTGIGSPLSSRQNSPLEITTHHQQGSIFERLQGFDGQLDSPTRSGRLTMGYRADCDKCIRRVPGHYSHLVWD